MKYRAQREIYSGCKTLQDVVAASCMSRIRERYRNYSETKPKTTTSAETIRKWFQGEKEE